jgi:hypothetical protein
LSSLVLCLASGIAAAQEAEKPETFFAGTVLESTSEKITIARVVRGKTENRTFRVTPTTKVEGKLRLKVRVTLRYVTDDEGDTAILIVVRPPRQSKPAP